MKSRPKYGFAFALIAAVLAVGFVVSPVAAQKPPIGFNKMSQVGFRLGGWANLGETPLRTQSSGGASYDIDFKGGCFYSEAYVGVRLSPLVMGELSLGIFNRGDVNLSDGGDQFYGNLLIYPVTLRAKIYPFGNSAMRPQLYLMGGFGLYYARHNIQFYRTNDLFVIFNTTSATDFNVSGGGGLDWPIAEKIALDLSVTYMPLSFSRKLMTIENYDGLGITVGIKYLFLTKK